jgi:hypothetical protein
VNEEQNILIIEGGQDELQPRVVAAQRKHKTKSHIDKGILLYQVFGKWYA